MNDFQIDVAETDDYTDTSFRWIDEDLGVLARCTRNVGLAFVGPTPQIALAGLVNVRAILENK